MQKRLAEERRTGARFERDIDELVERFERQIATAEQSRMDYVMTHPLRAMVYDMSYHPAKQKRERLFEAWHQEMVGDAEQNRLLVSQLRKL